MLRRVTVLCAIFLLFPAAAEAQRKHAAAINFDDAAAAIGVQPAETAAPPRPGRQEMQAARERIMRLGVRVGSIEGALQRSQAAGGLSLSSGLAEPADELEDGGLDSEKALNR
jgi:hypothetical protein